MVKWSTRWGRAGAYQLRYKNAAVLADESRHIFQPTTQAATLGAHL